MTLTPQQGWFIKKCVIAACWSIKQGKPGPDLRGEKLWADLKAACAYYRQDHARNLDPDAHFFGAVVDGQGRAEGGAK